MPIQVIWGNDIHTCDKEVKAIINKNIFNEWGSLNFSKYNGEDYNQLLNALEESQTPPLGQGSRVVLVKNNPLFNIKDETLTTKFDKNARNIPNTTYLILQNNQKPDSRMKTTKLLKKLIHDGKASELSFNLPDVWDKESQITFIENTANNMKIKLADNASTAIINSIGTDSLRLNNELEKARLYLIAKHKENADEIELTVEDIKKIFNDRETNIFRIIDNLIEKNISQSLKEIEILLNKGEPPLRLIAGLISQIRIHTIVLLMANEQDVAKVSNLAGINNPKRIYFIRKKINNCNPKYLINLLNSLVRIEIYIKKGNDSISVFIENLVTLIKK